LLLSFAILGGVLIVQPQAHAQDTANLPTEEAADVKIQPEAISALDKMANHLRTLDSFTLIADTTQDDVLAGGQKIEIAGHNTYRVRRPDRFVLDVVNDKQHRQYFYDGKTVTQFAPALGYYAVFEAPDTIAKTIRLAHEKRGIQMPLADLFHWGTEHSNVKEISSAHFVGEANVAGSICNHYAYRTQTVDFQVWIRKEGDPLPCKLVVNDRQIEVSPKYSATLAWDVGSQFDDQTFTFVPPEGAEKIDIEETAAAAN
jgi:hypothetical protein